MRLSAVLLSFLLLFVVACGGDTPTDTQDDSTAPAESTGSASAELSEDEKILYVLGFSIAQQLAPLNLTEEELKAVKNGVADASLRRESQVDVQEYGPKLQAFGQERMAAAASAEAQASVAYLDRMAAEPGAERLPSGLVFIEVTAGTGESPTDTSKMKVHYNGTLRDGRVFDSSVARDTPVEITFDRVIPCWREGLKRMAVGGKAKLVCPANLAYGAEGRQPQIQPNAALMFEVELLEILEP